MKAGSSDVLIVLDSGPLGLLSHPTDSGTPRAARQWATDRIQRGDRLVVPEIADYEVRRELVRAGKQSGVVRLDELCAGFGYEPLTTEAMRDAAALWAEARNRGNPTAHDLALDGDVILAAQARALATEQPVLVATTNTKHLERYVDASLWTDL
jgi:predicted nucleic acid-binding protein